MKCLDNLMEYSTIAMLTKANVHNGVGEADELLAALRQGLAENTSNNWNLLL